MGTVQKRPFVLVQIFQKELFLSKESQILNAQLEHNWVEQGLSQKYSGWLHAPKIWVQSSIHACALACTSKENY